MTCLVIHTCKVKETTKGYQHDVLLCHVPVMSVLFLLVGLCLVFVVGLGIDRSTGAFGFSDGKRNMPGLLNYNSVFCSSTYMLPAQCDFIFL